MALVDHASPIFSALACIAVAIACSWHFRLRNWTVVILAGWIFLWNFVIFIDGMVWWSDAENRAPVWCDISAKLSTAWQIGVPCASLLISRRLEAIASTRVVNATESQKRRDTFLDLTFGLGVPLIYTTLSIVYQGHRFDIIEGIGCAAPVYISWPYIILGVLPPLLISLAALVYSVLCLRHFAIRHKQFNAVLNSAGSNLNKSRYVRMMALSAVEIFINFPVFLAIQLISITRPDAVQPYPSWSYVHDGFGAVLSVPKEFFESPEGQRAFVISELSRWVAVLSGVVVASFFAFSSDAVAEYRRWIRSLTLQKRKLQRKHRAGTAGQPSTYCGTTSGDATHLDLPDVVTQRSDDDDKSVRKSQSSLYMQELGQSHHNDVEIQVDRIVH